MDLVRLDKAMSEYTRQYVLGPLLISFIIASNLWSWIVDESSHDLFNPFILLVVGFVSLVILARGERLTEV